MSCDAVSERRRLGGGAEDGAKRFLLYIGTPHNAIDCSDVFQIQFKNDSIVVLLLSLRR